MRNMSTKTVCCYCNTQCKLPRDNENASWNLCHTCFTRNKHKFNHMHNSSSFRMEIDWKLAYQIYCTRSIKLIGCKLHYASEQHLTRTVDNFAGNNLITAFRTENLATQSTVVFATKSWKLLWTLVAFLWFIVGHPKLMQFGILVAC